ncbi:MAG: glycosyltransferase [Oligoflexia bacterium]|nr:glycosyltransferase [Oligoflexia bacterium]
MKIAHVIWAQYPLRAYGGTERVCYWLAKGQAEYGHDVSVLCLAGSKIPFAKTIEIPESVDDIEPYLPKGTEMVQLYTSPNFSIQTPYLVNIGGNGQAGEVFPKNTVFVSKSHAERHGWTEYVYNGLDLSEYPLKKEKENYLLFLAKASWRVKNLKGAIRIARQAKMQMQIVGGRASCWHRNIVSHGMIGGEEKLKIIQSAKGLLFPVIWEEPFGLAVIEALACGTPVLGTPRGALPEIVDNSCGILSEYETDLIAAVSKLNQFDPIECRNRVEKKFSHHKMTEAYLKYYKKILTDGTIREGRPISPSDADPQRKTFMKRTRND